MVHNTDDDFAKYYRKPIGQLLLLDENILDWIKLTNPMGGGDGKAGPTPPKQHVRSFDDLKNSKFGKHLLGRKELGAKQTTRERVPLDVQLFAAVVDEEERRASN